MGMEDSGSGDDDNNNNKNSKNNWWRKQQRGWGKYCLSRARRRVWSKPIGLQGGGSESVPSAARKYKNARGK
jgi:hypothetical protein